MTAVLSTPALGFAVTQVFAEHTRRRGRNVVLLHEYHGAGSTPCYVNVVGPHRDERDHVTHPDTIVDRDLIRWCGSCWLGHRRCVVCSAPAGDSVECAPCTMAAIDADKRIERAA